MKIIDKHGNSVNILGATGDDLAEIKKHYPEYFPTITSGKIIELIIGKDFSVKSNILDMELEQFYSQTGLSSDAKYPMYPVTNLGNRTTPPYKDIGDRVWCALKDHVEVMQISGAIITLLINGGTYIFTQGPYDGKTVIHLTITYEV